MRPGPATRRLFPEVSPADLARPEANGYLIGRLLEEGDRDDLRWLVGEIGEGPLRHWLGARGARQLSRRSRAFWTTVLSSPSLDGGDDALWPL